MKASGISVERMFKQVRIAVMEDTDEQQVPWESSSMTGDFFFTAPDDSTDTAAPAETATTTVPEVSAEETLWAAIANSTNPVDYQAYLEAYPDGTFATLARARAESLRAASNTQATREASTMELTFWETIKDSDNAADYEAYVAQFPDGTFTALARNRIAALTATKTPEATRE